MPTFVENSDYNTTSLFKLANGTYNRHVVEYSCEENYYLSDEFANVTYECVFGAKWQPEEPLICIKGIKNYVYILLKNT